MTKILVIDDDTEWCDVLQLVLGDHGFQVDIANDGLTGLKMAYTAQPDLILLDVKMPELDGWETCQRFREMCDVPIIMVTSLRKADDLVKGINLGADDYISKPVTTPGLLARIRAVLRRVSRFGGVTYKTTSFVYNDLAIDFNRHEVTLHGTTVDLTPTEFELLRVLAEHKGRPLAHDFLLSEVWGPMYADHIELLRQYISVLRQKLKAKDDDNDFICTKRGFGYQFG